MRRAATLVCALFGALLACSAAAADPVRPHVLLICVDDLKPALGCYGDRLAKTPHIDRLAARGLRFDLAYCNQAVCAPSRNSLMLGTRPTSLGIYSLGQNFRLASPDAVTLTQHFMRHGWRAEAVGKLFHAGHGNHDDEKSWSVPAVSAKVVEYAAPPTGAGAELSREEALFANQLRNVADLRRGAAWETRDVADTAYADGRIADEGIRRLRAAAKRPDEPVFLALGFVKPHLPFTAPRKYWDLHDPTAFELAEYQQDPAGAPPYAGKRGGEIVNYESITVAGLRDLALQRQLIHGYYACTSFVDAQIGRVLDELTRLGLEQHTIVVLWGDHGFHLGDHGYWTKHTNYEQACRIPLIVVAPGVTRPGTATRQLAESVDLFPTLAELAGLPAPTGPQAIDGVSLVAALRDPDKPARDHAYHCYPRGQRIGRAIRTERYRLIEWKKPGAATDSAEYELYDYEADPLETKNLAAENPEVANGLNEILARHPEARPPLAESPASPAR